MSDDIWRRQEVQSPCIKICVMHPEAGLCTGCLRTRDEIARWSQMTNAERQSLIEALPQRRGQIAQRRGGRRAHLARNGTS